jgi:hypothetical protein
MLQVSRLLVEARQAEKGGNPSRAKQLRKRAQEVIQAGGRPEPARESTP